MRRSPRHHRSTLACCAACAMFMGCSSSGSEGVLGTHLPAGSGGSAGAPASAVGAGGSGSTNWLGDASVTADATSEQAPSLVRNVTAILRDFKLYDPNDATTNPDFEGPMHFDQNGNPSDSYFGPWDDRAIVTDALGADDKPVYKNATGGTLTTHGKASFDQWFTDVPGTNVRVEYPLVLTEGGAGIYTYDSQTSGAPLSTDDPTRMFFPIDDGTPNATVFGNQGDPHNYSFTLELHTVFTYQGGEFLHFRGDDDVFVYIDGKLVINLGGIHGPEVADVQADTLGLTIGKEYPLDFFYAERHKTGSNMLFMSTFQLRTVIIN